MTERPPLLAVGMMSGTSLDGVDAAILRTDGVRIETIGPALATAYLPLFRDRLRSVLGREPDAETATVAAELTRIHAETVQRLLSSQGIRVDDLDVAGFHGHTVLHRPDQGITRQIGDGGLLAKMIGIPVVDDFRGRDVAAGGQGAPFASLYHQALAGGLEKPLAVLNLGGVGNVTWIGDDSLMAFDTGPGNALLDDWTQQAISRPMDEGGRLARGGAVDGAALRTLLDHPYFERSPPKSLDRDDFSRDAVSHLTAEDGAATLTAFTAAAVARAVEFLPAPPVRWLVTGGGRHNHSLMAALGERLQAPVEAVEAVGWDGDALEAQAFAFLAVRSLYGLPLSLPATTGVREPTPGGTLHKP